MHTNIRLYLLPIVLLSACFSPLYGMEDEHSTRNTIHLHGDSSLEIAMENYLPHTSGNLQTLLKEDTILRHTYNKNLTAYVVKELNISDDTTQPQHVDCVVKLSKAIPEISEISSPEHCADFIIYAFNARTEQQKDGNRTWLQPTHLFPMAGRNRLLFTRLGIAHAKDIKPDPSSGKREFTFKNQHALFEDDALQAGDIVDIECITPALNCGKYTVAEFTTTHSPDNSEDTCTIKLISGPRRKFVERGWLQNTVQNFVEHIQLIQKRKGANLLQYGQPFMHVRTDVKTDQHPTGIHQEATLLKHALIISTALAAAWCVYSWLKP